MGRPKIPEGTHKISISATISPEAFEIYKEYAHKSERIEDLILNEDTYKKQYNQLIAWIEQGKLKHDGMIIEDLEKLEMMDYW